MSLRVAVAQIRPRKARPEATLERLGELFGRVARSESPPRLIVLPEAALTGYFLEGGVRHGARSTREVFDSLRDLWIRESGGADPLAVALGFYERRGDRVHNSALCAELGGEHPGVLHLHRKVFLPTYGLFQERRFLEPGARISAFDAPWGRSALLVCEDAWHSLSPTLAALDGARLLVVSSASPAHGPAGGSARRDDPPTGHHPHGAGSSPPLPGSLDRWYRILRGTAEEHGLFVLFAQLVGSEAGKVMPGGSAVFDPRGRLLARAPLWEEALLEAELDPGAVDRARGGSPLLADLEDALPRLLLAGGRDRGGAGPDRDGSPDRGSAVPRAGGRPAEGRPDDLPPGGGRPGEGDPPVAGRPDPEDPSPLAIEAELVREWLVRFLRQELEARGFSKLVVGLSGGVDSGVAAALGRRAVGPDRLHACFLPVRDTSEGSRESAEEMARCLELELRVLDLAPAVSACFDRHEPDASGRRRGEAAARLRALVLFDQGERHGALPLGTGNKSERLLGTATWRGDDALPLHPLGDLLGTQVRRLARALELPRSVVERAPDVELPETGPDGAGQPVPYEAVDLVLQHLLAGHRPGALVAGGFDPELVRWVARRLDRSHHRRNLPTVAVLTPTAVGEGYLRPADYRGG